MDYECTRRYWDGVAEKEADVPIGLAEAYTRVQCVAAFMRGLRYLPKSQPIRLLKTDLWTEGVVRSREVLDHVVRAGACSGYTIQPHGIDISRVTCKGAAEHHAGSLVQADIRGLPYAEESFDMILDMSTIDHVCLREAVNVLAGYRRCLRPGGVLVLMFAHKEGVLGRGDPAQQGDYFTFPVDVVRTRLGFDFRVVEEYAVHLLNVRPMAYLVDVARKIRLHLELIIAFQILEYSPVSRLLMRLAPMYVVVAVKTRG